MKISEKFNLNKTQYELDFVDVDTDLDLPLFLDPYFIGNSDFSFAFEAHLLLRSFFECLLSALRENKISKAETLFSHLGESNEICLGFSKAAPKGKGMGPLDAIRIFQSLKESSALKTGIMEDIEDFRIFVNNVDKDKVSDMTSNIIKKQLITYTQNQCSLWGIPLTSGVPSGFYWDRNLNTWENQYTDMLIINNRKILLVPKRIVSFSREYTPQKYFQHFVLNFLQDECLRLNSPLVQYRKDKTRTPYVTKKAISESINQTQGIDKNWLANFTKKNPVIFQNFRKETKENISSVSNSDIVYEDVSSICKYLGKCLRIIKPGGDSATVYHRTIVGIMELLFYPHLCSPAIEQEIHSGRKRIDISFDNCAEDGFFFRLCELYNIPASFIIVECKNYSQDVKNPELDQIGGRFSPKRSKMGILTCRTIDDMETFILRCSDTYNDNRGLIIPLVDEDFYTLLNFKADNNDVEIDNYIQNKFHRIALR